MSSSAVPTASSNGVGMPDGTPPSRRGAELAHDTGLAADPLERIFALGERATRIGIVIGVIGAIALHVFAGVRVARTLFDINAYALQVLDHVRSAIRAEFDVDLDEPPPPPPEPEPPPPEPEPEPAPAKVANVPPPPAEAAPPPPEPPPPAEAANVLTDPDAPVDLTGEGIVVGNSDRFAGGVTSSTGTSKVAVRDTRATPGATGSPTTVAPKVAGPPPVDRSRRARPLKTQWDCPFPKDADADGIDTAKVPVSVTVGPDGRPISATVVRDPGSGFGRNAQRCALAERYEPALDASGKPITQTQVFSITFIR